MVVEGNRGYHLSMMSYLERILKPMIIDEEVCKGV